MYCFWRFITLKKSFDCYCYYRYRIESPKVLLWLLLITPWLLLLLLLLLWRVQRYTIESPTVQNWQSKSTECVPESPYHHLHCRSRQKECAATLIRIAWVPNQERYARSRLPLFALLVQITIRSARPARLYMLPHSSEPKNWSVQTLSLGDFSSLTAFLFLFRILGLCPCLFLCSHFRRLLFTMTLKTGALWPSGFYIFLGDSITIQDLS